MADRYKAVINTATGRNVLALVSESHVDPDITVGDRAARRADAPIGYGSSHPEGVHRITKRGQR